MNTIWSKFLAGVFILTACGNIVVAQGFVNLSFESARYPLTPGPSGTVTINSALPGWTGYGYAGTNPIDFVAYNTIGIGGPVISFHDGMNSGDSDYHPYDG